MANWWNFDRVLAVLDKSKVGAWDWCKNSRCKYIELRIDMRDLHCRIRDRDGKEITPEELSHQFET